jgi:mannosyl-oligosaccharide alpha-1,2-mannosidase
LNQKSKVDALLEQAVNLANNLSYAFDTPSGIPYNGLLFSNRSNDGSQTNGLATAGTLVLEWTRLSDLTGDDTYGSLTQKAESYLLSPRPASSEPWPGLVGTNINITTGRFVDAEGGWNGGDDSFYEYLIKVSPVVTLTYLILGFLHTYCIAWGITSLTADNLLQMYVYDTSRFSEYKDR